MVDEELGTELRDVYDRLKEAVSELRSLTRRMMAQDRERCRAYLLPSLETALDDEHSYLGGCPVTLSEMVEKYEDGEEEDAAEEDEE